MEVSIAHTYEPMMLKKYFDPFLVLSMVYGVLVGTVVKDMTSTDEKESVNNYI